MALSKNVSKALVYGKEYTREAKVADHVPYARHVNDITIRTYDGAFLQVLKLEGFCHSTADYEVIDQMAEHRNMFLRTLGDSRYAVYSHIIRRRVESDVPGEFENPFAKMVNDLYTKSLNSRKLYVNDLYLTIIRRPSFSGRVGLADRIFQLIQGRGDQHKRAEFEENSLRELSQHVRNFQREMARSGARLLSVKREFEVVRGNVAEFVAEADLADDERESMAAVLEGRTSADPQKTRWRSEPLEFLAQLVNGGVPELMRVPRMALNEALPSARITFGKRELEFRPANTRKTRFGGFVGVRELDPVTFAGMCDSWLNIPGEFIVTMSFAIHDRAEALRKINLLQKKLMSSDEKDTAVVADMQIARDQVARGEGVNGTFHLSVMALGNTRAEMEHCVEDVTKSISSQGIVPIREDLNQEGSLWAQLPGNFEYIARAMTISSAAYVNFASFHNYAVGKRLGNHWGPAISLLMSASQTPYFFNFHVRQLGNFLVIGPSGSGKTVGLGFLASQAFRVNPRLAFFDKDRGGEVFIRALGGQYEVLEPGTATGFNPLQLEDTSRNRNFLTSLIKLMVRPRDTSELSAEEEKIVERAVDQIFAVPLAERRLESVRELLGGAQRQHGDDLKSRFEVWLKSRGWLFNNDIDRWDSGHGILGFDLTKILDDDDVRSAALFYIFHRLEELVDGKRPFMLFIDEGWKVLSDQRFSAYLNDKLKTIRKLKGLVGFGTQSAKDIINSPVAHTLMEQTSVNIFFPNPRADKASYQSKTDGRGGSVEGFKLSDVEFEWVSKTLPERREFLIRSEHESVVAKLDLSTMPKIVKVLSGTMESVEECTALRAKYGDDPADWLPYFMGDKRDT